MKVDLSLNVPPYRKITTGTGASAKHTAANPHIPQPQPHALANGWAAIGMKVLIKHLVISTAVNAEAEYIPNASTT